MSRVLVTGAGGFVGSNLVRLLVERGDEVYACVRTKGNRWRLKEVEDKITIQEVDLADTEAIKRAVLETVPEHIFHLAHYGGNRGQNDETLIRKIIIDGTAALYEAAEKLSALKSVIHAGTSSEYGTKTEPMKETMMLEPTIGYGVAKAWATLHGERLRREKGMPITTLRLFSVYGPYEEKGRFFPAVTLALLNGKSPVLSNPVTARDFVHVRDVAEAFVCASGKPFGIYNIGTGVQSTLKEAAELLKELTGSDIPLTLGMEGRFDTPHWVADMEHTKKTLGWQPKMTLREGAVQTVEWFRSNKKLYEN